MSVVRINVFGGLVPKDSARALPDNAAQTANELVASTSEFRPALQDAAVATSGVSNPVTLYRLARKSDGTFNTDRSTGWITSASDLNHVKAQINDEKTERTMVFYNGGGTPPRVIDATGQDRKLGVPAPDTAPAVVVNVVDEFTVDERTVGIAAALKTAVAAIVSNVSVVYLGADRPGTTTPGYVDRGGATFTEEASQIVRAYRLSGSGGTITDSYVALDGSEFSWIFDPSLNGFEIPSSVSNPSWSQPAGTYHYCIGLPAYAITYEINGAAAQAALLAIARPGDTGNTFFTADQAADAVGQLQAYISPTGPLVKPKLDALRAKYVEVRALMDGGGKASLVAMTADFYTKSDVVAEINAAIANFAKTVFEQAYQVAHAQAVTIDYSGAS